MTPISVEASEARHAKRADYFSRLTSGWMRGGAALAFLAALALLPSLFAPFVADDYFHIYEAASLREGLVHGWVLPIDLGGAWWSPHGLSVDYFRPLVVVSFAIDRFLFGSHALGYHLTNLVLHAGATILTWAIARRILGPGFSAWAAAALFAVHPCHVQAVAWISGRTDGIATVLYMVAFLLYLEGRARPRQSALLVGLSQSAFLLALFAKEMAITFPLLVFADGMVRPEGEPLARRLRVPALAAVVAGVYMAIRARVLGGLHPPPTPFAYHLGDPDLLRHLVTAPFLYLGDFTLFVPADPIVTVPFWKAHPTALAAFAAVVVLTFRGTLKQAPRGKKMIWALVWMVVTILPVVMLPVGEHFLYLPSVGYCVLVASPLPQSLSELDEKQHKTLAILCALVLAGCFGRTFLFGSMASAATKTVDEAAAALDRAPQADRLLVADVPTGATIAFALALSSARHAPMTDVEILSVSPSLTGGGGDGSIIRFVAPDRIELRRTGGFLTSYVERALAGPRTSFAVGETFERPGHVVTVTDAPDGHLQAFETRLTDPTHTLVLRESEHGLVPLKPYTAIGASESPATPSVASSSTGPSP